jgi:hypothetical protein
LATWLRFSNVALTRRSTLSGSAVPPPQSSADPASAMISEMVRVMVE